MQMLETVDSKTSPKIKPVEVDCCSTSLAFVQLANEHYPAPLQASTVQHGANRLKRSSNGLPGIPFTSLDAPSVHGMYILYTVFSTIFLSLMVGCPANTCR